MTWWRTSDDRAFMPDWKKALIGILISAGVILLFAGLMLFSIATLTAFTYQSTPIPADVQRMLDDTRQTAYALLVVGGGLVVIGYIERL